MKNIEIYTLDYCPFCAKAIRTLMAQGVEFKNIDSTKDEEKISRALKEKYKIMGEVTFPQIIINGERFGGNDKLQDSIQNGAFNKIFK